MGGLAFDINDLKLILEDKDVQSFLDSAMKDGMIRVLSDREKECKGKSYSITGHAYTVIYSCLTRMSDSRISLIVRPSNIPKEYHLLVGENTSYSPMIIKFLKDNFPVYDNGWFVRESISIDEIVILIKQLGEFFVENYQIEF